MALQSSGAISISDIKTELGSTSNSLRTLSNAAGFTTPDSMSEFYGYTALSSTFTMEYLIVAGGGGGGAYIGGGGGAGGLRTSYGSTSGGGASAEGDWTIVVGDGQPGGGSGYYVTIGAGGTGGLAGSYNATGGGDSYFASYRAVYGGGGGQCTNPRNGDGQSGENGGSGGGTSYQYYQTRYPGLGTANQGYDGGLGNGAALWAGGGGGAAGAGSSSGAYNTGAAGGAGLTLNITGSNVTYAKGGQGAGNQNPPNIPSAYYPPQNAPANTGEGGHGSWQGHGAGNGGSGVVIFRYPTGYGVAINSGSLTYTVSTNVGSSGYDVCKVTAGDGYIEWYIP